MSSASVDGLVSGLSTSALISQLMTVEKQGQTRLQARKTDVQADVTALQAVNTAFSTLAGLARDLAKPSAWQVFTTTTTNDDVATATASGGAATGTFAFTVDRLATAASKISSASVTGTSAIVASGPLTITKGSGAPVTIDVGDGSLASVVGAINDAGAGVRAAAVEVSPGAFKLQLTSSTTGAGSSFTVGGTFTGLGTLSDLTTGQDSQITVGSGAAAYTITSSTNEVKALSGTTISLKGTGAATIGVELDGAALADKVQKVAEAVNSARFAITSRSSYDATTRKAGVLLGEGAAQRLLGELSTAVSGLTGADNAAAAGITLNRDGTMAFDRAKFLDSFQDDPAGTARLFTTGATGSGPVRLAAAAPGVRAGHYEVVVTAAATRSQQVGAPVATLSAQTIDLKVGELTASYEVAEGADLATVAAGLNQAAAAAQLGLVASVESGALVVRSAAYGSRSGFSLRSTATDSGLVSGAGAWTAATTGTDVAGTIDGKAATGSGQTLTGAAGTTVAGLSLVATASGAFDYAPGVMARLATVGRDATDRVDGTITSLIAGRQARITDLDKQISSWDVRLSLREKALKRQFSNLETALGRLRDQSGWLASQISTLQ